MIEIVADQRPVGADCFGDLARCQLYRSDRLQELARGLHESLRPDVFVLGRRPPTLVALRGEVRPICRPDRRDVSANSALEEFWKSALRCRLSSCAVVAVFFLNKAELESVLLVRLY